MESEAVDCTPGGQEGADGTGPASVLVVDDDPIIGKVVHEVLTQVGFDVTVVDTGRAAVEALAHRRFDVVLSDIAMPGMTGVQLLDDVRAHDLDVPVILMTGYPKLETAIEAVARGALRYLTKPVTKEVLVEAVQSASRLHRLARMKREALKLLGEANAQAGDRAGLNASLERAMASMWMAFQPIVEPVRERIFGYEALMRSNEPSLPHPGAILDAAERLGRLQDLGRRVRTLSAAAFEGVPGDTALLFINLHTRDLLDPSLYEREAPLTRIARRVVLEITERAAIDDVKDIAARVDALRALGFRIAIDDLGAGYAGLSSFVALRPEIVKLDMSLVRNVHQSDVRRRLVEAMTSVAKELGMRVIAEGIETLHERDVVHACGCDLMQGYLFARPAHPFPVVDRATMAALGSAVAGASLGGVSVGSVIDGRYELRRDLGRGASGVVYEAQHGFTGRSVAIKLVGPDVPNTQLAHQRARLTREARALAAVRHPGVVEILDGGVLHDGTPYIVMEKLTGRTLEALIALRARLSTEASVAVALQLCDALAAVHRAGVVHRDLKPANVLLSRDASGDERIAIVDFGIAQVRTEGDKLTESGTIIGTPAYMAPEQLQALDDVDHRADVYAVGIVLFECLTGDVPFLGSYVEILMQVCGERRAIALPSSFDRALEAIITRATAKDPRDRYADAAEMAAALRAAFPAVPPRTRLLDAAAEPAAEQRRQRREAYTTPVRITLRDGVLDGRIEDIAEGGLLVIASKPCAVGLRVNVRFAAPIDGRIVTCSGDVRWTRSSRPGTVGGPHAVGVEFVDPPADLLADIRAYIALMGGR